MAVWNFNYTIHVRLMLYARCWMLKITTVIDGRHVDHNLMIQILGCLMTRMRGSLFMETEATYILVLKIVNNHYCTHSGVAVMVRT